MMPVWPKVSVLISLLWASIAFADTWVEHNSPDQLVQVWVKPQDEQQRYDIVRAEITIQAPILPLLAMLQDAEHQQQWLPYTKDVRILAKPSSTQTLVQFRTLTRWPFKPRDAITQFNVMVESKEQLRIEMINLPQQYPNEPGFLRIREAEGYWLLSALPECKTRVRYQSGSRWGGMIPQWLVNTSNRDLAVAALMNLKRWVETDYSQYEADDETVATITAHNRCP